MRWVGIDEAGYGPNLGPLVMTAVVAESPDDRPPDLWNDHAARIDRAGGDADRLWVDDSKVLYRAGQGRDRLEAACLAAVFAAGRTVPTTLGGLLGALDAGNLDEAELTLWLDAGDPQFPSEATRARFEQARGGRAFDGVHWRIKAVRTIVVGPERFNAGLAKCGSKARVHFAAFARLLEPLWELARDGVVTRVRGDKHGSRHFYYEPLLEVFADAWIDRGVEGPELSRYTVRASSRSLELSLEPRADSADGLVALASVVSKTVRELWMDAFNAHWCGRIPDLRPTAGYPTDAARFRMAIEPLCAERGLDPRLWWRLK
jgi:hypothetical protein